MSGEETSKILEDQRNLLDELSSRLNSLLKRHNISMSLSEVFAIVDGVNASALSQTDDGWVSMVSHSVSAELRLTLCELREQRLRSFSRKTSDASEQRLCLLRKVMDEQNLDGFLLPRADEYQSEYLPRSSQRLAWLTGFDGSAGFAIVLAGCAAIFTDGRYTLQIRDQVNEKYFEIFNTAEMLPLEWLKANLVQNERIGFDPWLHTCDEVLKINSVLASKNATEIQLPKNLID